MKLTLYLIPGIIKESTLTLIKNIASVPKQNVIKVATVVKTKYDYELREPSVLDSIDDGPLYTLIAVGQVTNETLETYRERVEHKNLTQILNKYFGENSIDNILSFLAIDNYITDYYIPTKHKAVEIEVDRSYWERHIEKNLVYEYHDYSIGLSSAVTEIKFITCTINEVKFVYKIVC
jgi:hypothetical protein